jgi:hypothetical protein
VDDRGLTLAVMLLYPAVMRIPILCLLVACTTTHSTPTLVPEDATRVVIHSQGGLAPLPPEGSTCMTVDETFTVDLATGAITYHVCSTAAGNSPYAFADGQLSPTADDTATIRQLIADLPTTIPACGGDIHNSLTVITPGGTSTYEDLECMQSLTMLIEQLESLFDQLGSA